MTVQSKDQYRPLLTASYTSPTDSQTFEKAVATAPSRDEVQAKTTYLSALRSSARTLQENINTFLTMKMEQDKAISGSADKGRKAKDEEEEENYGEETGEQD